MMNLMTRGAAATAVVAGLAVSFADAQIFQREVGDTNPEWAYSIDVTMDGGHVSAGFRRVPNLSSEFHIVKYKADGTTEWEVTFGGDGEDIAYSIQQTKDGGYIVAGESTSFAPGMEIVLLRLDATGAQLWANSYPGTFMADPIHTPHPGVALDQGWEDEIYVVGRIATSSFPGGPPLASRPIAFRADMGGTLEWYNEYVVPTLTGDLAELAFTDVAFSEIDGSAVISGTLRTDAPVNPNDPTGFVLRQDATLLKVSAGAPSPTSLPGGFPIWFNRYDSVFDRDNPDFANVWETGDGLDVFGQGEIVLGGRTDLGLAPAGGVGGPFRSTYLVHTDIAGSPFWSTDYENVGADGTTTFVETAYAAVEYDERIDAFIQAGRIAGGAALNTHTQLTAPGGAPIWAWRYGGSDLRTYGESVQPEWDGCGYAYAGRINNPTPPPGQGAGDIYFVRNNDKGETGCLEQPVNPEPVAPLRPQELPIQFDVRERFEQLPKLTRPVEGRNTALCFDPDCDPGVGPCNAADIALPFGVLDLDDVNAFILSFLANTPPSDIAPPFGVWDLDDVNLFITEFLAGCP